MSIGDIFREGRMAHGIKHKPNWAGNVFGACQTKGCGNHHKVSEYYGGFCKVCSTRTRETQSLPTCSPKNNWINKKYVKDLSHLMTEKQRKEFYDRPSEWEPYRKDKEVEDMFKMGG